MAVHYSTHTYKVMQDSTSQALYYYTNVQCTIVCPPSPPRPPPVLCPCTHTQGGEVPNQIRICTAQHGIVWVPILFVLKGIFLLSGVFLAVQTWNIKLKSINDSQLIAVAIVAVFFATVVAAMVAFFLRDMVDLAYGITAGCGIIVGYLLLCLLYLKKVRPWSLGVGGHFALTQV